ncbi:Hpt domain-containing protein [Vibrio breoganii]
MLRRFLHSLYKASPLQRTEQIQQEKEVIVVPIEQLIDNAVIEQIISDTSIEILPLLIDSYLEESQGRLEIINKALDEEDYQTLEFETHTLAGTSLAIGVSALGKLAKSVEQSCLQQDHAEALKNGALLKDLAIQSQQALQSLKESL